MFSFGFNLCDLCGQHGHTEKQKNHRSPIWEPVVFSNCIFPDIKSQGNGAVSICPGTQILCTSKYAWLYLHTGHTSGALVPTTMWPQTRHSHMVWPLFSKTCFICTSSSSLR